MTDPGFIYKNGSKITFRVTMLLGLIGTIIAGGWYAGVFSQEVESMKEDITSNTIGRREMRRDVIKLQTRAAGVDATGRATERRLNSIDATLRRIEEKIDSARATQRFNSNRGTRQ